MALFKNPFLNKKLMKALDRSYCILSSKYLDLYFFLTVGECQPLSLAIYFRTIKCDLTLLENNKCYHYVSCVMLLPVRYFEVFVIFKFCESDLFKSAKQQNLQND